MSWRKSSVRWLATGSLLALALDGHAQERAVNDEPRRWSPSFVYGATAFGESDPHQTLGATFRLRLADRLYVEPELRYMRLPSRRFESSEVVREAKHSDVLVAANLVYDFLDERKARFVPYMTVGAGWGRTRNERSFTELTVESAVPVFPGQTAPRSGSTQTSDDWLWLGAGLGLRIILPRGFFVSPEIRLGGTSGREVAGSAAIKVGYGF